MNGTLIWLVTLIQRIANGERLEHASRSQWKMGLSVVAAFCLFGGVTVNLMAKVNPQSTSGTWLLATGLCAVAFFGWYYLIRRLPVIVLLLIGVAGWLIMAFSIWK